MGCERIMRGAGVPECRAVHRARRRRSCAYGIPNRSDPIAGYGSLGFNQPGSVVCPGEGACCVGAIDVTCAITSRGECQGTWIGPGTTCDPDPCSQPDGSCCAADGTCAVTTQADCTGTWTMFGICDPNPCPLPPAIGACCYPDDSCTVTVPAACLAPNIWQGAGTLCEPNPCTIFAPILRSVVDIGNDQGRQVRLRWRRSLFDAPAQPVTITGYAIFRELGQNKVQTPSTLQGRASDSPTRNDLRLEGWDYLLTVPAFGDTTYLCVAPTLCDSTISGGLCLSTFMVRAMTSSPFEYYDSVPLSGYSVDNLAPGVPGNLRFVQPTVLAWDESGDDDFGYFTVYGSASEAFDPTAEVVLHTTSPGADVSSHQYDFYHVTATDFAGNEGASSGIMSPLSSVEDDQYIPTRFALYQSSPNPTAGGVVIAFDLPAENQVELVLIDVTGRELARIADKRLPAGRHRVWWDSRDAGGAPVPSGVYFYRLDAGTYSDTRKLLLTRR